MNATEAENKPFRDKYWDCKELAPEAHREIYELLLKGLTKTEISPIMTKRYSDVDRHTVYRWINDVLRAIADAQKANEKEYGSNVGLAVGRLSTLYQKALEAGELRLAYTVLKELHRIQGITETKPTRRKKSGQVDVSGPMQDSTPDLSKLSDEELKRLVEGTTETQERDERD